MWNAPSSTAIRNMSALSDCSIMLYVMTERWPGTKKYRDAFEAIKRFVLSLLAEDKHQPGKSVTPITADMRTTLQGLDVNMVENVYWEDLEQMISDMTGEQIQLWNDIDPGVEDGFEGVMHSLAADQMGMKPASLENGEIYRDLTSEWIASSAQRYSNPEMPAWAHVEAPL